MSQSRQPSSVIRDHLQGIKILSYPKNQESAVRELIRRVQELGQDVTRSGLHIGSEHYEGLRDKPDTSKLEERST